MNRGLKFHANFKLSFDIRFDQTITEEVLNSSNLEFVFIIDVNNLVY